MVQIEITSPITHQVYYFPCSITVMDNPPRTKSNNNNRTTASTTSSSSTKLLTDTADHPMNVDHDNDDDDNDNNNEAVGGKEMPFLFGLDMLKRHLCCLDMSQGCLRFTQIRIDDHSTATTTTMDSNDDNNNNSNSTSSPQYLEVPFLHEKDLLPSQGGTKKPNPPTDP
jgi:hypothetical protein